MTQKIRMVVAGAVLLGLVGGVAPTRADVLDRTMFITFSRSVALPGVELAAGTYRFELADPMVSLSLVRVSSKDRRHVYLTAFTNLVDRPAKLRADQVVSLGEAAPGKAPAIKVWYPAANEMGREFLYRN